jgi:hypothetical protein
MTPLIPRSIRRAQLRTNVMAACALTVIVQLATAITTRAAEPGLPNAEIVPNVPAKPAVPSNDPAVQTHLPGCAVWTDRCVTCRRVADGTSCSNIGIACQPQVVECIVTESAEEKPASENKPSEEKKQEK